MRDKFTFSTGVSDLHDNLPSILETGDKLEIKNTELKQDDNLNDKNIDDEKLLCGLLYYRPSFLQKFRTAKWALFWLCWAGSLQGIIVNGFINVVITTIEKRFNLTSKQTGLIAGGYDIASFLLLVPVSYLGGRSSASKPKYIGMGVLILGIGSILFASPQYIAGTYRIIKKSENLCQQLSIPDNSTVSSCTFDDENDSNSEFYLAIFFIAQLVQGAGAAPFYTLGVTYLDENVSKKMSSVYLGIYYTTAVIGPALGYVIGGELLKIYTDFMVVDPASLGMTSESNVWIGAWWIGFVASAIICFIIAIPILAFPAELPGSKELAKEKISEAHEKTKKNNTQVGDGFTNIKGLPHALKQLLSNPAFFMLNLAGSSEGLLVAGFAAFLPKLIENQFSVSPSSAALLMGLVTVPAGGGGTFLGGYLVKRWNLSCSGILKFCIISTGICIIFTACFGLTCPNHDFAGLTVPYTSNFNDPLMLNSTCNNACGCTTKKFNPICGVNGVTYYSPCHAGCQQEITINDIKVYKNCTCINDISKDIIDQSGDTVSYEAINTSCSTTCSYLKIFVVLAFCNMLMTFMCTMPALSATLRVVKDEEKSFALGIQWIKVRILGTIPAPIIFGALIDDTCILWNDNYEGQGACLVYDNYYMSRYMLSLAFIGKCTSLVFFFFAWWCYIPPGTISGRRISPDPGQQPIATIIDTENLQIESK